MHRARPAHDAPAKTWAAGWDVLAQGGGTELAPMATLVLDTGLAPGHSQCFCNSLPGP